MIQTILFCSPYLRFVYNLCVYSFINICFFLTFLYIVISNALILFHIIFELICVHLE